MAFEMILQWPLKPFSYVLAMYRTATLPKSPSQPRLLQRGQMIDAKPHCERVGQDELSFCEDVRLWHSARVAVCASDPARPVFNAFTGAGMEDAAPNGRLGFYHLDTGRVYTVDPEHIDGWPEGRRFHPLGMGVLEDEGAPGERAILASTNYGQKGACIEIFQLAYDVHGDAFAVHVSYTGSIEHPNITTPNAVVPLSPTIVLFTESFGLSPRRYPFLFKIEQLLAYPGGSVRALSVSAEGHVSCTTLASGISLANGLAVSSDRSMLAVAGCTSLDVHIYDIFHGKGGVTSRSQVRYRERLPVNFIADNLSLLPQSTNSTEDILILAGHANGLDYLKSAKSNGKYLSGSKVAKISVTKQVDHGKISLLRRLRYLFKPIATEVTTLFESPGDFYGTSSTATVFAGEDGRHHMLVNGLWEKGLLLVKDVSLS